MKARWFKSGSRRRKDESVALGFCRSTGTPPQAPSTSRTHGLLEQLHFGDIVQRRRQRHADEGDIFPALVLGADDGRAPGRQMLQALDPTGRNSAQRSGGRTSGPGDRRLEIMSGSWEVQHRQSELFFSS